MDSVHSRHTHYAYKSWLLCLVFQINFSDTNFRKHNTLAARLTDDSGTITTYRHKNDRLTCCRKSDNNGGKSEEQKFTQGKRFKERRILYTTF